MINSNKKKYSFSDVAKILDIRINNQKIGRNKIIAILKDANVIDFNNQAYSQFVDKGYFENESVKKGHYTYIGLYRYALVVGNLGLNFVEKLVYAYFDNRVNDFLKEEIASTSCYELDLFEIPVQLF